MLVVPIQPPLCRRKTQCQVLSHIPGDLPEVFRTLGKFVPQNKQRKDKRQHQAGGSTSSLSLSRTGVGSVRDVRLWLNTRRAILQKSSEAAMPGVINDEAMRALTLHNEVTNALRNLSKHSQRVIDMFKQWDADSSGSIDRDEFRGMIQKLGERGGPQLKKSEVDAIFQLIDTDQSGLIEFRELNKVLRQGTTVELAQELQAGAKGEITRKASNRMSLRRAPSSLRQTLPIAQTYGEALVDAQDVRQLLSKLMAAVRSSGVRILDLYASSVRSVFSDIPSHRL